MLSLQSLHDDHRWLLKRPSSIINSNTKICFLFLLDCTLYSEHMHTYSCKTYLADISRGTGMSKTVVKKSINSLIDLKLITVSPKPGEENMYTILKHDWM